MARFFFWHNCKANTYIFFYVYVNFLPVLHIVNSLKITKTLMYSVLSKMRYKKQNWMQGQHNGKMLDFFNWSKFRLTKSVFFRATAVNRGTHVYPRMSKGYLQPLVLICFADDKRWKTEISTHELDSVIMQVKANLAKCLYSLHYRLSNSNQDALRTSLPRQKTVLTL